MWGGKFTNVFLLLCIVLAHKAQYNPLDTMDKN